MNWYDGYLNIWVACGRENRRIESDQKPEEKEETEFKDKPEKGVGEGAIWVESPCVASCDMALRVEARELK